MSETGPDATWVFGYGSLIYKVDFPYLRREVASIEGWERRFWQGSHDHRGTPEQPGRVVTLTASPGALCRGVAYRVEESVFVHLDHREKNGYVRAPVQITLAGSDEVVAGVVYYAAPDNPAFLGAAPMSDMARHIAGSTGPSGSNRDYLCQLVSALEGLEAYDEHVFELNAMVAALGGPDDPSAGA
ncbi:gamma-glutamylcyclotransferase [Parahaliea maris]|uniref:glutathione-specific gamma-glutamylcyclotransferase n=1 Tax=Parahaliea maris TaxID=2716870 RepID=A0A5C9A2L4_9GAMM|nr:gamma-glutamylcyclotransferase [Parahaliea maris]TXS94192.1 gamma-glutamylcyclotransferase [Parahaliea maris]